MSLYKHKLIISLGAVKYLAYTKKPILYRFDCLYQCKKHTSTKLNSKNNQKAFASHQQNISKSSFLRYLRISRTQISFVKKTRNKL